MPKLPKGMVKKGHRYYLRIRDRKEGRRIERTIPLGDDRQLADVQYARMTRREVEFRGQPTVEDFSRRWLTDYVAARRSGTGPALAEQRLNDYVLPVLGSMRLGEVTAADLMTMRAALTKTKLSVQSVRHVLSDVRCLLHFAVDAELIPRSPFRSKLVMPTFQEEVPEPLSDDELDCTLKVCPPQHQALVRLAVFTGARYGELRGLEWDRIALVEGDPHLFIQRTGNAIVTKSKKVRRIPLVVEAAKLLEWAPRRSSWVFTGRFGEMIAKGPTGVSRVIAEHVPGFHFHRLRHTFACRLLAKGIPLAVLQRLLGHSTIKLTERYARLFDPTISTAMRSLPADWIRLVARGEEGGKIGGSLVA